MSRDDLDRQFDALCARYADLPPRAEQSARDRIAARRLEHLIAKLTARLDARDRLAARVAAYERQLQGGDAS